MISIKPRLPSDLAKEEALKIVQEFSAAEVDYFTNQVEDTRVITIDGLLVEFNQTDKRNYRGWFQFRQSLSEPTKLYLDFEATSIDGLKEIIENLILGMIPKKDLILK